MDTVDAEGKRKCAHEQCRCEVPSGQKYCGDYCSGAEKIHEIELQCDCGHSACALDAAEAAGEARAELRRERGSA